MINFPKDFQLPPELQWENLTLANDFMFGKVMHNKDLCTKLIRLILPDKDIGRIDFIETQKSSQYTFDTRGVRFDSFSRMDDRILFICEMQAVNKKDIPKRTRAYHIEVGAETLSKNFLSKSGSYNDMPDVFVIFICTFDPFKQGRHIYTFYNMCSEDNGIKLNDGAVTIFLNAKGTADDVSPGLKAFLDLVLGKTSDDPFVMELEEFLQVAKQNVRLREMYMFEQLRRWEYEGQARAEGRAEGKAEGIAEGRAEGIIEGRAEGRAEGKAEGIIEGKAEGHAEEKFSILQKLLDFGMKPEDAVRITGVKIS